MSHGRHQLAPDSDSDLAILRLAWRLDALDEWRKEVTKQVDINTRELDRLVKADEIADAVADRMKATQSVHLSKVQSRWVVIGIIFASLGSVGGIIALALQLTGVTSG